MAYCRCSLPAQKSFRVIQRGVSNSQKTSVAKELQERSSESPVNASQVDSPLAVNTGVCMFQPIPELQEPTGYELESRASVAGWASVRNGILTTVTESAAMPAAQFCISCEETAFLRCQQCGPLAHFCSGCFDRQHCNVNIFHVAKKWEVGETIV